jgi:hypothetical protein
MLTTRDMPTAMDKMISEIKDIKVLGGETPTCDSREGYR